MASINAKKVAEEVLNKVRMGKKVNLQEIQQNHGYTKSSAKAMKATRTSSYKEAMDPAIKGLKKIQQAIIAELASAERIEKLPKEKLIFLSSALKNTTHDLQLLTGGKTEDLGIGGLREDIKKLIDSVNE